jgi:cephalosporin hydroxylase
MRSLVLLAVLASLAGCRRPDERKRESAKSTPTASGSTTYVSELQVADPLYHERLLEGFYSGTPGWLWTARRFAVLVDVPPPVTAATLLELDFGVPAELMDGKGPVTVTARVNGTKVGRQKYKTDGRYHWQLSVPAKLLSQSPLKVEYELDRWGTEAATGHDIGLMVVGVNLRHPDSMVVEHDPATEAARRDYVRLLERRKLQMPLEKQKEMMKLFHDIPIWSHMWFHNVPIEKNPLDLWMMQQIIYETQPEMIVETGTFRGGSALYWAHTLNGMGLENSRVLTVDIGDYNATAATHPLWKKYVTFFKGSSTDAGIVAEIAKRTQGRKTLVTLDSDHSMQHVLNELRAYAPLVTKGSYLVVEDTHIDGVPTQPDAGPGPLAAVMKFLEETKDFEQDFSREAFIMTFNPGGWLRRK